MMNNLFGKSNWLYEINSDNSARFVLGERGENPLICVGVNPSIAEPNKLDPTLRCVKAWSKRLGYDGWIMLNLYPQRATNPNDLHIDSIDELCFANFRVIREFTQKYHRVNIWAAWGTLIEKRPYLRMCLDAIVIAMGLTNQNWFTIGKRSIAGHPHHPLYLSRDAEVANFNIVEYLKKKQRNLNLFLRSSKMLEAILTALAVSVATAVIGIIGKAVSDWSAREKAKAEAGKAKNARHDAIEALDMGIATISETVVKGMKEAAADGKLSKSEIEEVQTKALDEAVKIATNPNAIDFLIDTSVGALSAIISSIVQSKKPKPVPAQHPSME